MSCGTKTLVSLCAVFILFNFGLAFPGNGQDLATDSTLHINRLIGAIPYLSGGGTIGYCQEWYRVGSHRSMAVSFDYVTWTNTVNTVPQKYYSVNLRPGIRYYYSSSNKWFFHTVSLLAAYENNPISLRYALSIGAGVSIIGFRIVLKRNIILELEGFLGYGLAYLEPYQGESFFEGRFFSLENFRLGYRF